MISPVGPGGRRGSWIVSWWLAARPKTLTAALVPVAVGTALARATGGRLRWWVAACALAAALLIQVATNLFNDAIDFARGADGEDRLGPLRVTQAGIFSGRQVMTAGIVCCLAAVGFGVPLVVQGGWLVVGVGLVSLLCAFGYTGGPYPLAYHGMGDLFVLIFFGVVAVAVTQQLHTGALHPAGLVAGVQVGLWATALIAINNLRDVEADRRANKRTMAVRFGAPVARVEIVTVGLLPFGLGLYWLLDGLVWAALLPVLALPLALRTVVGVWRERRASAFGRLLGGAALTHLVAGLLLAVGLWMR